MVMLSIYPYFGILTHAGIIKTEKRIGKRESEWSEWPISVSKRNILHMFSKFYEEGLIVPSSTTRPPSMQRSIKEGANPLGKNWRAYGQPEN